jgi:hypothetical protein
MRTVMPASGPPTCHTDQNGRPCGKPAVAELAIIPLGQPDIIAEGRIRVCMRHLLPLLYTNGVGAQELGDVIDLVGFHHARSIAADLTEPRLPEPYDNPKRKKP